VSGRRTVRLTLAYDGTAYSGWQRQKDRPTLQRTLEEALLRLTGCQTRVIAAGRTDAGVHALGQVVGFKTDCRLDSPELGRALNALLPQEMRVLEARDVDQSFHARYGAESKCYRYHLWAGAEEPLFLRRYLWAVARDLDLELLRAGLGRLIGRRDFAAFRSTGSPVKDTVRHLSRAELKVSGRLLTFVFEADGFLRHMVRALVGTLVGQPRPEEVEAILASGDRGRAGRTAPARGLFLAWVSYPGLGRPVAAPGPFDPLE